MKVYFNRFAERVQSGQTDCYLITGEEPWQRMAAANMVREYARKQGYVRSLFFTGPGFEPGAIIREAKSSGLFGEDRRLIDLRIDGQVSSALADVIKAYSLDPPDAAILMIQIVKADARKAWVKSIAQNDRGTMLVVYNKTGSEFKSWLKERILEKGLIFDSEAEDLLAMRVDGNLPAAANALEKIKLANGEGQAQTITAEVVASVIDDSSRYSAYDLADAAVIGDLDRAVRILYSLKADNIALPLLLWVLVYKIRLLADATGGKVQGPPNAQRVLKAALKRKVSWHGMLHRCAEIDAVIKSSDAAKAWNAVFDLVLRVCGVGMGDLGKGAWRAGT